MSGVEARVDPRELFRARVWASLGVLAPWLVCFAYVLPLDQRGSTWIAHTAKCALFACVHWLGPLVLLLAPAGGIAQLYWFGLTGAFFVTGWLIGIWRTRWAHVGFWLHLVVATAWYALGFICFGYATRGV